jgi:hypothetical protein
LLKSSDQPYADQCALPASAPSAASGVSRIARPGRPKLQKNEDAAGSSAFDRNLYEFASRLIAFELGSEAILISNGSAEAVGM